MEKQSEQMQEQSEQMKSRIERVERNLLNKSGNGYDGTTALNIFKLQFETTAAKNNWTDIDKAAALVVALKGNAADILQTVPETNRHNNGCLMNALETRYGNSYKRVMYYIELKSRTQRSGETSQEYAADIERLVQFAYPDEINGSSRTIQDTDFH